MTELIDSFQPKYPKGRGKAITLLILTSIGSLGKLIISSIIFYVVAVEQVSGMRKDEKFVYFTILVTGACGLLNFVGSLMMLKQRQAGIWVYIVSQLITALLITWCIMAVNSRLEEAEQVFLLIVYVVTIVYTILYLSNWKYYSPQPEKPGDIEF